MSSANVTKLKKQAAELEQKRQLDKALAKYIQILDALDDHVDEADIALYNRVGDLLMRQSKVSEAVDYYEKAVDLYTEGGFFNNAIALCNKILRNAPGRTSVYHKLGRISAKKGFIADAKQNFLEYADRMQRAGQLEEAFRALAELADLCPDQEDIRLMLAEQLARKDRKTEAIEQLQTLYEKLQSEGRSREARATAERMQAIDPDVAPRTSRTTPSRKVGDLVFLDVSYDLPGRTQAEPPPEAAREGDEDADRELPFIPPDANDADLVVAPVEGLTSGFLTEESPVEGDAPEIVAVEGLESSQLDGGEGAPADGLEHTSIEIDPTSAGGIEDTSLDPIGLASAVDPSSYGSGGDGDLEPELIEEDVDDPVIEPDERPPALSMEFQNDQSAMLDVSTPSGDGDSGEDATAPLSRDEPREPLQSLIEIEVVEDDAATLLSAYTESSADEVDGLTRSEAAADSPSSAREGYDGPTPEEETVGGALPFIDASEGAASLDFEPPEPWSPERESDPSLEITPSAPQPELELSTVERLRRATAELPDDGHLHRQLGEALLEDGDREGGMLALEDAMVAYERMHDYGGARSVVEEILRLEPNSIGHHQKRVEYAFRSNDRSRLVDAYLALADCLFRRGQVEKCRAVYSRVIELAPDDRRAREALRAVDPDSPTPGDSGAVEGDPAPGSKTSANGAAAPERRDSFVNLASWLSEDVEPKSTRMVADVDTPKDESEVDFRRMLDMFKEGVAANVDDTDHESHYDLGVAYKEMGLLDEAIAEFQKALRGTENRVRTYEALGQCFVEKRQHQIAVTILSRALTDRRYTDDMLVGVLYLLGTAHEALGQSDEARQFYERVVAVDIGFADTRDRLAALEAGR